MGTYSEFLAAFSPSTSLLNDDSLPHIFQCFDADGDGELRGADVRATLGCSADETTGLLREAGASSAISFSDLRAYLSSSPLLTLSGHEAACDPCASLGKSRNYSDPCLHFNHENEDN